MLSMNFGRHCPMFTRRLFFTKYSKATQKLTIRSCSKDATIQSMTDQTVHVYPISSPPAQLSGYRTVKTVHFIRHAEGTHNVNESYREVRNLDARLTKLGIEQCKSLAESLQSNHPRCLQADLIVTSPLTRCIQTALHSMKPLLSKPRPLPPRVVAVESLRETVNYISDKRRNTTEIASEFPQVDTSHLETETDEMWSYYEKLLGSHDAHITHRESAEVYKVAQRGRNFFRWLGERNEENIVVCTHSAFLRAILNFGMDETFTQAKQGLDKRPHDTPNIPVVRFMGNQSFDDDMRQHYKNCELRSMMVAFLPSSTS